MKKASSTIRWDTAERRNELVRLARRKGYGSVNRLVNSLAEVVLAQEAAEATFRAAASRGNPKAALALLDELDERDRRKGLAGTKP
jgi:hypothetical protein